MTTVAQRLEQAERAGYGVLAHFDMGREAMDNYYGPLEARVEDVETRLGAKRALDELRRELKVYAEGFGQFSYEMFVLGRP